MRIIDIPEFRDKKNVYKKDPHANLEETIKEMASHNFGAAVVVENNKVVGIFSERDLLVKVVGKGLDIKNLTLKDVMTTKVSTAFEEDAVLDSLRQMSQGRFRHLPIVDKEGNLMGIVSQGDFVAYTWGQLFHHLQQNIKSSFLNNTQQWMLLIILGVYLIILAGILLR